MTSILVVTSLYPNAAQPRHGIFVETRLRQLTTDGSVDAKVVAPVPWFPLKWRRLPEYSKYVDIPHVEYRYGIEIHHPRYLVIPRIGMLLGPFFMALSILKLVRRLRKSGLSYDIVDAHYYYPDGVAVALISKFLGGSFMVTARGSDINLIARYTLPRKLILWATRKTAASITVSMALKKRMVELGAQAEKIHVLRNGVDLELFRPLDQENSRSKYGITRKTLLSVGNLVTNKGHHHVIETLNYLPDMDLIIVGAGEEKERLEQLVLENSLGDRVTFIAEVDQAELPTLYSAADILVLASSREGWPNVLLESMACGTPVIATRVGGIPEIVTCSSAGILVSDCSGETLANAVIKLLINLPTRESTRAHAEKFSWNATVMGIKNLMAAHKN